MDRKKVIWFINKDAAPIDVYATHLRTVKQAQYFQEQGYDVKLICSANVHNSQVNYVKEGWFSEQLHDGVPFVFVKSLNYGQSMLKRVLAYSLFALRMKNLQKCIGKPDIIIHTSRIPFDLPIYFLTKSIKAKYILDVTDLWPNQFERFGMLSSNSPILKLFYNIEKKLYEKADHVVISMEGGQQYIKDHKWDLENGGPIDLKKIHYVNNGIDLNDFNSNLNKYTIEDKDLEDETIQKVIYLGSIRLANNLEQLIEAAKCLLHRKDIKFLIYGDGTDRLLLEDKCVKEGITNVVSKQKWIEPQYVPYVMSKASVNVLNYGQNWGIYGGSMNKMFMSFACAKPIICNAGMRFSPIRDNQLGIDSKFESSTEYANALLDLLNMSDEEKQKLKERSSAVAQEFHIPYLNKKFQTYCEI